MQVLYVLIGFILGVGFTLLIFSNEIYHGTKVGYGPEEIHPE